MKQHVTHKHDEDDDDELVCMIPVFLKPSMTKITDHDILMGTRGGIFDPSTIDSSSIERQPETYLKSGNLHVRALAAYIIHQKHETYLYG